MPTAIHAQFLETSFDTVFERCEETLEYPCPICMKEYKPQQPDDEPSRSLLAELPFALKATYFEHAPVVMTSCKHHYCLECICHWITRNPSCPMCRAQLELEDPNIARTLAKANLSEEVILYYVFEEGRFVASQALALFREVQLSLGAAEEMHRIDTLTIREKVTSGLPDDASFLWHIEDFAFEVEHDIRSVAQRFPPFQHLQNNSLEPHQHPSGNPGDAKCIPSVIDHFTVAIQTYRGTLDLGVNCTNWQGAVEYLAKAVYEAVPYSDESKGAKARWKAYLRCASICIVKSIYYNNQYVDSDIPLLLRAAKRHGCLIPRTEG